MVWDEALDMVVAAMNGEHRDNPNRLNQILDASAAGQKGGLINLRVGQLGEGYRRHCAAKGAFMLSRRFPGLESRRRLHQELPTR